MVLATLAVLAVRFRVRCPSPEEEGVYREAAAAPVAVRTLDMLIRLISPTASSPSSSFVGEPIPSFNQLAGESASAESLVSWGGATVGRLAERDASRLGRS